MTALDVSTRVAIEAVVRASLATSPRATKRVGSVQSFDRLSDTAQVIIDGESVAFQCLNTTGYYLLPNHRVVVEWVPPHQAMIVGVLRSQTGALAVRPWGVPWGILTQAQDTSSPSFAALTPDLIVSSTVPLLADRWYQAVYNSPFRTSVADTLADFSVQWRIAAGAWSPIRSLRGRPAATAGLSTDTLAGHSTLVSPGVDGNYQFKVVGSRIGGTGTITMATMQTLDVLDLGPTA